MSDELLQTIPQQIGKFTYYRLGATTLDQLKAAGIIPKKNYAKLRLKKPDGLVAYHGEIKAVVEYKRPEELRSAHDIEKATLQEIEVAKKLCRILIVTDGTKSFWVNALNGDSVRDAKGNEVRVVFHPFAAERPPACAAQPHPLVEILHVEGRADRLSLARPLHRDRRRTGASRPSIVAPISFTPAARRPSRRSMRTA